MVAGPVVFCGISFIFPLFSLSLCVALSLSDRERDRTLRVSKKYKWIKGTCTTTGGKVCVTNYEIGSAVCKHIQVYAVMLCARIALLS